METLHHGYPATNNDDIKSRLEQYKSYSPKYLRQRLKEKIYQGRKITADTNRVFASVLFADISGFTQLSSRLSEEELKTHINEYFTKLLGIVQENSGDVVKFCGDAVLIMWAVPLSASKEVQSAAVLMSAVCALQLLEECGEYRRTRASSGPVSAPSHIGGVSGSLMPGATAGRFTIHVSPSKIDTIELSLHCGISCGEVNCMTLGDAQRLEFLLSGDVIHQMGAAEGCAKVGEVCLHPVAYAMISDALHAEPVFAPAHSIPRSAETPANGADAAMSAKETAPPVFSTAAGFELAIHCPALYECVEAVGQVRPTSDEIATVLGTAESVDPPSSTSYPEPPVAYLLTGRLAESLLQARAEEMRTKRDREVTRVQLDGPPLLSALDPCRDHGDEYDTHAADALSADGDAAGTQGVSADTAMYLQTLVRELSATKARPLLRSKARVTTAEVRSFAADSSSNLNNGNNSSLSRASMCVGIGEAIDENAEMANANESFLTNNEDSPNSASGPGGAKSLKSFKLAGASFLSRFRSTKFRSSFTVDSLNTEQSASAAAAPVESPTEGTLSTSIAHMSTSVAASLTSRQSFFFSTQGSGRSPTAIAGRLSTRNPRALSRPSQKLFSGFFGSQSSLSMVPPSTASSAKASGNRTHSECTTACAADSTGDGAGELSARVRAPPRDRSGTAGSVGWLLQDDPESGGGTSGAAHLPDLTHLNGTDEPTALTPYNAGPHDAVGDHPATGHNAEAPFTPPRKLAVSVLKRKLKFATSPGIQAVRAIQDNWEHGTSAAEQPGSPGADIGGLSAVAAHDSSSFSLAASGEISSKRARLVQELRKFIHETAVRAIDSNTVTFLSELRDVAVVFTQILDLEQDFTDGLHARPQKIFCVLLKSLRQFGGSLRQFVVDDKGCVAIACFGLAGSSNQNNCSQAVDYAVSLRTLLHSLSCRTASGITLGRVYCGIVGAGTRCEYAVMGSSVNLAARLMAACALSIKESERELALQEGHHHTPSPASKGVMVDSAVHHMAHNLFQFQQLAHINAKGYTEPVKVFAAIRKKTGYKNFNSAAQSYLSAQSNSASNAAHLLVSPTSPPSSPTSAHSPHSRSTRSHTVSSPLAGQCLAPLLERDELVRSVLHCLIHGEEKCASQQRDHACTRSPAVRRAISPASLNRICAAVNAVESCSRIDTVKLNHPTANYAPFTTSADANTVGTAAETVAHTRSVFIQGPSGVGRSRFLCHVLEALQHTELCPDVSVALLQCDPANQYVPFDVIRAILYKVFGICEFDARTGECDFTGEHSSVFPTRPGAVGQSSPGRSTRICSTSTSSTIMGESPLSPYAATKLSKRRRTVAHPSALACAPKAAAPKADRFRRRHSSGSAQMAATSGRRRSLNQLKTPLNTMTSIAEGAGLESSALPGFLARRLTSGSAVNATHLEDSSDTASGESAASSVASAADLDPHFNSKIQSWCSSHLQPSLTLAVAFQVCYPALELVEVLQYQYQYQQFSEPFDGLLEGPHRGALEWLSSLPAVHFLPLLNDLLGCSLSYPTNIFLVTNGGSNSGGLALADAVEKYLSSDMQDVLTEVLLQTLVLAALGCLPDLPACPVEPTAPTACWMVAVDDLQHADVESVLLISKALSYMKASVTASEPSRCGAFVLTSCESSTAAGFGHHTHSGSNNLPHPLHSRRVSFLYSTALAAAVLPEELFSQRNLHSEELSSHEKLMGLVHRHCKVVTLPKLTISAVRTLTIQVLGLRRWMCLMNSADAALGVAAGSRRKASAVSSQVRRLSMIASPTHGRFANSAQSSGTNTGSTGSNSVTRRNGVSSTANTCSAALSRLLGNRCSSEARLDVNGRSRSPSIDVAGIAMAAAGAAAAHRSMFHPLCSEDQQDRILALLYTHSQHGIPGSVLEIATSLRDSITAGTFRGIPHLPVIVQRNKLILEVLDNLSGMEVAVLKAASVIGSQFAVPLLSATLSGMDLNQCEQPGVLNTVLNNLVAAGLIQHVSGATDDSALTEESSMDCATASAGACINSVAVCAFIETSTQLAVYNLMLEAQRTVAHSVIAAYLEHAHSFHCQPAHLLQIAYHYQRSDNCRKKLEYLSRTAELYTVQGDVRSAVQGYSDMVQIAMGTSLEELVGLCKDQELTVLLGLEKSLQQARQDSADNPLNCSAKHQLPASKYSAKVKALPNNAKADRGGQARRSSTGTGSGTGGVLHSLQSLRRDLFPNQVAVFDGVQEHQRPPSASALGAPHRLGSINTGAIGVPLQSMLQVQVDNDDSPDDSVDEAEGADYLSLSLCDLLVRRKVAARTVAALKSAGVAVALPPQEDSDTLAQLAVRSQVGILGVSLVQVAGWVTEISHLLTRAGRQEEGLECTALSLLLIELHGSDLRVQELLSAAVLPAEPSPSLIAQYSTSSWKFAVKQTALPTLPQGPSCQDLRGPGSSHGSCIIDVDPEYEDHERFDAHTQRALAFLDAQTESYQQQARQRPAVRCHHRREGTSGARLVWSALAGVFKAASRVVIGSPGPANNFEQSFQASAAATAPSNECSEPAEQSPLSTLLVIAELSALLLWNFPGASAPAKPKTHKLNLSTSTNYAADSLGIVSESLLALAMQCALKGEAEASIVLLEEVLIATDNHDRDYRPQGDRAETWAQLSVSFRSIAASHSAHLAKQCLTNDSARQSTGSFHIDTAVAWHQAASGQFSQAVQTLGKALAAAKDSDPPAPPGVVLELHVRRCWLHLFSGDLEAAAAEVALVQELLGVLAAHHHYVGTENTFLREISWIEELQLLLQITSPEGSSTACELTTAVVDSAGAYHKKVMNILLRYSVSTREACAVEPLHSPPSIDLDVLMSTLRRSPLYKAPSDTVQAQLRTLGVRVERPGLVYHHSQRSPSSLSAAVLECISLWTVMKELLGRVSAASASNSLNSCDQSGHVELLVLLSLNLAQVGLLAQTSFTALAPFHAILCVQYELLVHRLYQAVSAGAPTAQGSVRPGPTGAAVEVLQCLHQHVFSAGIFKTSTESLDVCPDSPIKLKPVPQVDRASTGLSHRIASMISLAGCAGTRTAVINTDTNAADIRYSPFSNSRRPTTPPPTIVIPSALAEYKKGLTVPKLHKLRAYLHNGTAKEAPTREPDNELCRMYDTSSESLHDTDDNSSDTESTASMVQEPPRTHSGSADSTLSEIVNQSIKQQPVPYTSPLTVHISANSSSASAAELDMCCSPDHHRSHLDKRVPMQEKCAMFAFLRPMFDDVSRQIDAAEDAAQEELCQYIAMLMDRMQD